MKLLYFLLLLLLPLLSSATTVGVWSPIGNPKDPHVIDIANDAVTQYNYQNGTELQLEDVLKGQSQVIDTNSMNYQLTLKTYDAKAADVAVGINYYLANIYENYPQNIKLLNSFEPINSGSNACNFDICD